jgi:hypothetical protein
MRGVQFARAFSGIRRVVVLHSRRPTMRSVKMTSWQDGDFFVGFLNQYPDYQTQGQTIDELKLQLKELLIDLESGQVPYIHRPN